jgi:hypothetical protein
MTARLAANRAVRADEEVPELRLFACVRRRLAPERGRGGLRTTWLYFNYSPFFPDQK